MDSLLRSPRTRARTASLMFAAAVCGSLAAETRATVIYNTFGPGNSYNETGSNIISTGFSAGPFTYAYRTLAVPFTAPYNSSLNSVSVATYHYLNADQMIVQLMADDGTGLPGAVLETYNSSFGTGPATPVLGGPTYYTPTVETSSTHPLLTAGQTYWISVGAVVGSSGTWNTNSQGVTGAIASYAGSSAYGWEHTAVITLPP